MRNFWILRYQNTFLDDNQTIFLLTGQFDRFIQLDNEVL